MLLTVFAVYLAIGIAVEYAEELISVASAPDMFKGHTEVLGFDTNNVFNPITERVKNYNVDWFLTDLSDVVLWPFGIYWWIKGIRHMRNMNDEEIEEIVNRYVNNDQDS